MLSVERYTIFGALFIRTAKFTKNGEVYYAFYDETGLNKGIYGDKKSDQKGYKAKINIGADGNYIELAENALYDGTSPESGKDNSYHDNAKTWDYYVKTIKCDGIYYDVLVNIKDTGNNQYVYDITLKEKEATSLPDSQGSYDGSLTASTDSIPQPAKNATQNSLSDTSRDIAPVGNYNIYGKDIALEQNTLEDIAPR